MNAIEIKNVSKSYKDFELKDFNLTLPSGCIMGLVGENGAGKSTTIKLIMNAIKADNGEIFVMGKNNTDPDFDIIKDDIGVVLDEANFPEVMNAKNVNEIMKNTYKNWNETTYFSYLKQFSLPLDKRIKDYSRGMTMKLTTAVALSHNAKLLILDEATGGLDPIIRDEILDIFNAFTIDTTHSILISSHIVSDLEKICDYIAFIHQGKLMICEEKDKLKEIYGIIHPTEEELKDLQSDVIVGVKKTDYSIEALVRRDLISSKFNVENASIEEIILFIVKGGKK
ncbi:MAG: ABC transporter ATP-binding protein [Oscillospiraceae bacterium]